MSEDLELWEDFQKIIDDYGKHKDLNRMKRRMNFLRMRYNQLKSEQGRVKNDSLLKQLGEFL